MIVFVNEEFEFWSVIQLKIVLYLFFFILFFLQVHLASEPPLLLDLAYLSWESLVLLLSTASFPKFCLIVLIWSWWSFRLGLKFNSMIMRHPPSNCGGLRFLHWLPTNGSLTSESMGHTPNRLPLCGVWMVMLITQFRFYWSWDNSLVMNLETLQQLI